MLIRYVFISLLSLSTTANYAMEREELAKLLDANASTEDLLKASQNFGRAVGFQQEYKEGISKRTGQVVKCVKLTAANRQKKKYTIEQHDEAYNNQK